MLNIYRLTQDGIDYPFLNDMRPIGCYKMIVVADSELGALMFWPKDQIANAYKQWTDVKVEHIGYALSNVSKRLLAREDMEW